MKSQFLKTALKFLFAAAIIGWLASTGKFDFKAMEKLVSFPIIALGLTLTLVNIFFTNERWLSLLKSQNLNLDRWVATKLTLIGLFFNFVVPGGVGGDLVKGYYASAQNPNSKLSTAVSVAMDRLLGLYTMILMALLAFLFEWSLLLKQSKLMWVFMALLAIFILFSGFWMVVFSRRAGSSGLLERILMALPKGTHFKHLFKSFNSYSHNKSLMFKSLALSFIAQIIGILFFVAMGRFMGFQVSLATYFFVVPIGFIVTAIPISPAGVGVGQAAFYYLFNLAMGETTSLGTATITAMQLFQFSLGLVGAWFFIGMSRKIPKNTQKNSVNSPVEAPSL